MTYDPAYAHLDALRTPNELRERRNELMTKARELSTSGELVGDDLKAFEGLEREVTEVQRRTEQLERIMRAAQNPWNLESGDGTLIRDEQTGEWVARDRGGSSASSPAPFGAARDFGAVRDRALRVIERHKGELSAEAGDRLDRHVRTMDPVGLDARYIERWR
jgi:hypothetical protein